MYKILNEEQKRTIIGLRSAGFSYEEISKKTDVPESTIEDICRRNKQRESNKQLIGSGRKNTLTPGDIDTLIYLKNEEPKISATKLNKKFKEATQKNVTNQTIRNCLKKNGFKAFSPVKKPFLKQKNIEQRFQICKK